MPQALFAETLPAQGDGGNSSLSPSLERGKAEIAHDALQKLSPDLKGRSGGPVHHRKTTALHVIDPPLRKLPISEKDFEQAATTKLELFSLTNSLSPRPVALQKVAAQPQTIGKPANCCGDSDRVLELEARAANEPEARARERALLELAGHYAGQNDWASVKSVYDQILATSQDDAVSSAVQRNLLIADKNLEIERENEPAEKERLQLELARLHFQLGHSKAAQHICRELMKSSKASGVRTAAGLLLESGPELEQFPPGEVPPRVIQHRSILQPENLRVPSNPGVKTQGLQ